MSTDTQTETLISAVQFCRWAETIKYGNLADTDADLATLMGISRHHFQRIKRNGGDAEIGQICRRLMQEHHKLG